MKLTTLSPFHHSIFLSTLKNSPDSFTIIIAVSVTGAAVIIAIALYLYIKNHVYPIALYLTNRRNKAATASDDNSNVPQPPSAPPLEQNEELIEDDTSINPIPVPISVAHPISYDLGTNDPSRIIIQAEVVT